MPNDLPRLMSCIDQPDNYTLGFTWLINIHWQTVLTIQHCIGMLVYTSAGNWLSLGHIAVASCQMCMCVRPVWHVEVQHQQHH